jgi:hypothetical protein
MEQSGPNDHEGPGVIPGRYAEEARKADADRLAGQICAAATLSAQATCTLLELVGEFDASGALRYWVDLKSVAHWLSWTCSMAPGVAREHVRIARALRKMPTVLAEFRQGRLSYSKVREISRVVDIIDETRLVELARTATAAQLATMIAAFRSCDERRLSQQEKRALTWHEREDGMVDLRARLTKEDAAVLVAAVHAAKDQITQANADAEAGAKDKTGTGACSMVDALVDVGRVFLDTAPEDRSGEDRTLVVVHISAELLAGDVPAGTPDANVCHIDGHGPIEPATAQRLACDNPVLPVVLADGNPLALGRTRRLVSRAAAGADDP